MVDSEARLPDDLAEYLQVNAEGRAISVIHYAGGKEIDFAEVFAEFDKRFDRIEDALGVISERLSILEYKALIINERVSSIKESSQEANERLSSVSTKLWVLSKENEGSTI